MHKIRLYKNTRKNYFISYEIFCDLSVIDSLDSFILRIKRSLYMNFGWENSTHRFNGKFSRFQKVIFNWLSLWIRYIAISNALSNMVTIASSSYKSNYFVISHDCFKANQGFVSERKNISCQNIVYTLFYKDTLLTFKPAFFLYFPQLITLFQFQKQDKCVSRQGLQAGALCLCVSHIVSEMVKNFNKNFRLVLLIRVVLIKELVAIKRRLQKRWQQTASYAESTVILHVFNIRNRFIRKPLVRFLANYNRFFCSFVS